MKHTLLSGLFPLVRAVSCSAVLGGGLLAAQSIDGATPIAASPGGLHPGPRPSAVWVVDDQGGPGSDFTIIQAAIQAARDGDVILVRSGYYDPFALYGKSLVLVADDDGFQPALNYTSEIEGLEADQSVIVRGLGFGPTSLALRVADCSGPVWLSDCRIEGHDTFGQSGTKDALRVENCAAVVLDGCLVSSPDVPYGENGCVASQSHLTLWESTLRGGLPDFPSTTGGAGLALSDGSLFAAGCTFVGGTGGFGGDWGAPQCYPGGLGGTGLLAARSRVTLRDSSATGGPGGSADGSVCADGASGPAIDLDAATNLTVLAPVARTSDLPRVLRGGTSADLELTGRAGDRAFVFLGVGAAPTEAFDLAGVVVPGTPWTRLTSLTLDANGRATASFPVPVLPASVEALVVVGQPLFFSAQDGPVLGSPFVSVVLGPGL